MRVIICGAGQVGYGIAERLAAERNDVSVIDTSAQLIQAVRDTLDVRGFVGHGSHPEVLEAAGAQQADMIIAVTLYDEVNIVACEIAHALFNVPTKIARIRSQSYLQPQYQDLFSRDHMPTRSSVQNSGLMLRMRAISRPSPRPDAAGRSACSAPGRRGARWCGPGCREGGRSPDG